MKPKNVKRGVKPVSPLRSAALGASDNDLRNALEAALYSLEEGVSNLWVEAIFESDNTVVYNVMRPNVPSQLFERTYEVAKDGTINVNGGKAKKVRRKVSYGDDEEMPMKGMPSKSKTQGKAPMKGPKSAQLRSNADAVSEEYGLSDSQLRSKLWQALYSTVAAFDGISDVFQSSGVVIYMTMPDRKMEYHRRTFNVDNNEVTLNEDDEKIEPVVRYELVNTEDGSDSNDEPGLTSHAVNEDGGGCQCKKGANAMKKQKPSARALVAGLIANEASPFSEKDAVGLRAMELGTLTELDELYRAAAEESEGEEEETSESGDEENEEEDAEEAEEETQEAAPTVAKRKLAAKSSKPPTSRAAAKGKGGSGIDPNDGDEAAWLAKAPASIRDLVSFYQNAEAEQREALIDGLCEAQDEFTEQELEAMPTRQLRGLAKVAGLGEDADFPVDFSGRGEPASFTSNRTKVPDPPKPYTLALAQRGQGQGVTTDVATKKRKEVN